MARTLALENHVWTLGRRIGDPSGFGQVFLATADDGTNGVVKLVPKEPGADRELLFENLAGTPNVVPIIDSGETRTHWALAMPRAERSLRAELATGRLLTVDAAVPVLIDMASALAALDGLVVHRDLKPENVLFLEGSWCLADFGIARYAEATTSTNTWKDAWSAPYAAPERWRHERAKAAADVYSLGVMAHEMLAGDLPFGGPETADFRDQHLHRDAPDLSGVPASLAGLVTECLFKDPGARPTAANVLARLGRVSAPPSRGAAALQSANAVAQAAAAEEQARISAATSDGERREALLAAARRTFGVISTNLRQAITDNASAAKADPKSSADDWSFKLGAASLGVDPPKKTASMPWGSAAWAPAFTVIAHAAIGVSFEADQHGYRGRTDTADARMPCGTATRSRRASSAGSRPHSWSCRSSTSDSPRSRSGSSHRRPRAKPFGGAWRNGRLHGRSRRSIKATMRSSSSDGSLGSAWPPTGSCIIRRRCPSVRQTDHGGVEEPPRMPREDQRRYVTGLLSEFLGPVEVERRFDWARGDSRQPGGLGAMLPFDAVWDHRRLIVEIDERQHAESVAFFDKPNRMTVSGVHRGEQRRRYDERKVRCAREQGYKVLRIPTSGVSYRGRYLTHDHRADRRVLRELLDEAGIDVD